MTRRWAWLACCVPLLSSWVAATYDNNYMKEAELEFSATLERTTLPLQVIRSMFEVGSLTYTGSDHPGTTLDELTALTFAQVAVQPDGFRGIFLGFFDKFYEGVFADGVVSVPDEVNGQATSPYAFTMGGKDDDVCRSSGILSNCRAYYYTNTLNEPIARYRNISFDVHGRAWFTKTWEQGAHWTDVLIGSSDGVPILLPTVQLRNVSGGLIGVAVGGLNLDGMELVLQDITKNSTSVVFVMESNVTEGNKLIISSIPGACINATTSEQIPAAKSEHAAISLSVQALQEQDFPVDRVIVADGQYIKAVKMTSFGDIALTTPWYTVVTQPIVCDTGEVVLADTDTDSACEPCAAGTYASADSMVCELCLNGTYSESKAASCMVCPAGYASSAGSSSCTPCEPGSFAVEGSAECAPCESGKYSVSKAESCQVCPTGEISSTGGASACTACDIFNGVSSNSNHTACSECIPGYFMNNELLNECILCPIPGTSCVEYGTTPVSIPVAKGFWRTRSSSINVLPCEPAASCEGDSTCRRGHMGPQCSVCLSDYSKNMDGFCERCGDISIAAYVTLPLLVIAVFYSFAHYVIYGIFCPTCQDIEERTDSSRALVHKQKLKRASFSQKTLQNAAATRHRTNIALSFVKLLLNFMQIIVGAGDAFQVDWPSAFGWWLFIIERIATLDITALLAFECTFEGYNFYTGMRAKLFSVLVGNALFGGARLYLSRAGQVSHHADAQRARLTYLWIAINYLCYATVCYAIFRSIPCTSYDDGTSWLTADLSIDCNNSAERTAHVTLAVLGVLGWVVGIPAIFLILLRRSMQSGLMDNDVTFQPYLFLTGRFRREAYWFDPITFAQKATVGGVFVFLDQSAYKFLFGVVVATFWFGVGASVRPFPTQSENITMDMLNFASILFLIGGLSFYLDLSEMSSYADTMNNILLWTCSLGMMIAVLTSAVVEMAFGDWRIVLAKETTGGTFEAEPSIPNLPATSEETAKQDEEIIDVEFPVDEQSSCAALWVEDTEGVKV
eukprot:CAMPEP_0182559508 /NCGR_PEP_ID=MMETSP1324-20130603/2605_1 /TAXON_ID=236786 /ORGANISM="Florenciella sp., Strain RCC1587" /LENGTH=1018 /DNA_ID=CAMNT_0024771773 /DNA_START=177 /DNA_END=3233 /DNA_ORIENTATION=-